MAEGQAERSRRLASLGEERGLGLTCPLLGSLGTPARLLRPSTYTTSQQAWSSLCRLLPALMTLPGHSEHIRLHAGPGPGITPSPQRHTHLLPAGQAEKGHSHLGCRPGEGGEGRAGKEYCLDGRPYGLTERPAGRQQHLPVSVPHPFCPGQASISSPADPGGARWRQKFCFPSGQ